MKYGAWCCAVWLLAAASLTAVDKMTVRITPTIAIGPATVRIHVFTEQDADNRALEVVADSGDFYRSSLMPFDGNRAPRAADFVFTDLPPGQYLVRAALIGSDGKERFSVTRFLIIS
jgi:uncharacterized protein (DUF2141 family)